MTRLPVTKKAPPEKLRPFCRACGDRLRPKFDDVYADGSTTMRNVVDEPVSRAWNGHFGLYGEDRFCNQKCATLWARVICRRLDEHNDAKWVQSGLTKAIATHEQVSGRRFPWEGKFE